MSSIFPVLNGNEARLRLLFPALLRGWGKPSIIKGKCGPAIRARRRGETCRRAAGRLRTRIKTGLRQRRKGDRR